VGKIEDDVYEGLVRATHGKLASVTVEGQRWVHLPPNSVLMPKQLTENMRYAAARHVKLDDVYSALIGARPTIPT